MIDNKTELGYKLIQFYAVWCAPCKALEPIVESVAKKLEGKIEVERIDVESDSDLVYTHQIRSVPTLMLFKDGEVVWRHLGTLSEGELTAVLEAKITA